MCRKNSRNLTFLNKTIGIFYLNDNFCIFIFRPFFRTSKYWNRQQGPESLGCRFEYRPIKTGEYWLRVGWILYIHHYKIVKIQRIHIHSVRLCNLWFFTILFRSNIRLLTGQILKVCQLEINNILILDMQYALDHPKWSISDDVVWFWYPQKWFILIAKKILYTNSYVR